MVYKLTCCWSFCLFNARKQHQMGCDPVCTGMLEYSNRVRGRCYSKKENNIFTLAKWEDAI